MRRRRYTSKEPKRETSKILLEQTKKIFIWVLILALIFSWLDKDLGIFIYAIPAVAAVYGATICFYLNKAKMENIFKGKIEFLKIKLELQKSYPQFQNLIEDEINGIEDTIDNSINNKLSEILNSDEKLM